MEVRHQHSTSMSEKKDIYAIQREVVDQHKQHNNTQCNYQNGSFSSP